MLDGNKKADFCGLALQLNELRLSFAKSDELMEMLGVEPGRVTPFAIPHNKASYIQEVIDPSVTLRQSLGFHSQVNTASVCISKKDLLRRSVIYGGFPADIQTDWGLQLLARTTDAL
ncbi:YbaK/EbsC family protein [Citrobacter portucalensis]|uniref:YbaK/EbsC family protein n=1 Tax=Citrobacter portucalensis TaxID=1639133 RepID=UPI003C304631